MRLVYNYILNGSRFVIQDGIGQEISNARTDLLSHFCPVPAKCLGLTWPIPVKTRTEKDLNRTWKNNIPTSTKTTTK